MLSYMTSRPCPRLAMPAAKIAPNDELVRNCKSFWAFSSPCFKSRQTVARRCAGATLERSSAMYRSILMLHATTEHATISGITHPPATRRSLTVFSPDCCLEYTHLTYRAKPVFEGGPACTPWDRRLDERYLQCRLSFCSLALSFHVKYEQKAPATVTNYLISALRT